MTVYGVQPEGFNRKPLNVILSEVENANVTEYGPDVIQTSQSPLGQLNGLFANLTAQLWEMAQEVYQANDVDQAEGRLLDTLAKLRLIRRGTGEQDAALRLAVTNQGRARIDVPDIERALLSVEGVTYAKVFLNDTPEVDTNRVPPGTICAAVLGGSDDEVATALRPYIVPGISTYGNVQASAVIDGYCRTLMLLRPILVPAKLRIWVRARRDANGCPPPAVISVRDALLAEWTTGERRLLNGDDFTSFRIRSIIESSYPNVEVVSFQGWRDDLWLNIDQTTVFGFIEMAQFLSPDDITVSAVP